MAVREQARFLTARDRRMTLAPAAEEQVAWEASIDDELTTFFDRHQQRVNLHGLAYSRLWDAARRSTLHGKRIRPTLVLNTYRAFGGTRESDAAAVAVSFELLHTAFLLHDDVIDGDTVRRGRDNLIGEFAADAQSGGMRDTRVMEWGRASAILAGDLLLHSAGARVARLDIAPACRNALIDLLEDSLFVTAAGELYDVAYATNVHTPVLSEVLTMTEWKTAHYSFQAPLRAGALLADAPQTALDALDEYGRCVGIAFQLRDDLLGVFGDEDETGKSLRSDLGGTKMTALLIHAMHTGEADELRSILGRPTIGDSEVKRARAVFERCGARSFVERMIAEQITRAQAVLGRHPLPGSLTDYLMVVADRAGRRVS